MANSIHKIFEKLWRKFHAKSVLEIRLATDSSYKKYVEISSTSSKRSNPQSSYSKPGFLSDPRSFSIIAAVLYVIVWTLNEFLDYTGLLERRNHINTPTATLIFDTFWTFKKWLTRNVQIDWLKTTKATSK